MCIVCTSVNSPPPPRYLEDMLDRDKALGLLSRSTPEVRARREAKVKEAGLPTYNTAVGTE